MTHGHVILDISLVGKKAGPKTCIDRCDIKQYIIQYRSGTNRMTSDERQNGKQTWRSLSVSRC